LSPDNKKEGKTELQDEKFQRENFPSQEISEVT